ncbi:hypothetical protein JXB37_00520 [candidate division WOR-3 bacterium]|nr:hypothetical protein [candidate division WOR-3 bacterium]
MKNRRMAGTAVVAAAGLLLLGGICTSYNHYQVSFRAPVQVTRGGDYDPGRLVTFAANKLDHRGSVETGSRLTADRFTDFLGQADFLFGYKLQFDEKEERFVDRVRVVAMVDFQGTLYADTLLADVPRCGEWQEVVLDTLRIALPAR